MEKKYFSANEYFRSRFGVKLIKIALDGGFTCPNRDGTLSRGGCIFCSPDGSGDFSACRSQSITSQLAEMKEKMSIKWKSGKYLAYFQAFTNTYAPVNVLREKYTEAISDKDVLALSVATRPDCLSHDVLALLSELNEIKPVFVELGLQSSKPETVKLINRCYENSVFSSAVKNLHSVGINTVAHIILGLPYETKEDMLASVSYAAACGIDGIKLQLLHILKNTALEQLYYKEAFKILTLDEYVDIVISSIELLPPSVVIHRITGDGNRKTLIEPKWSLDKKRVLNAINNGFINRNTFQGRLYRKR